MYSIITQSAASNSTAPSIFYRESNRVSCFVFFINGGETEVLGADQIVFLLTFCVVYYSPIQLISNVLCVEVDGPGYWMEL